MTCLHALVLTLLPAVQDVPPAQPDRATLERRFGEMLTGARLVGSFTSSFEPGAELQEDSYTITRATKQDDGRWLFQARIEFGGRAVPFAIALPVEWAGETPVITVTDLDVPMLGTYTARVLFHGNRYAGIWSGKDHGGHMFGSVEKLEAEPAGAPGKIDAPKNENRLQEGGNWPSFRGEGGSGVAEGYATPVEWNVEKGKNVKWRVEVPGLAHSSPVIWGDRLFVTSAIRLDGEQILQVGLYGSVTPIEDTSEFGFLVFCYDKETGEELWEETAWEGVPRFKRHPKGSYAASTPATDGEHVAAFFGTEGLYCYDMEGKLLWKKDFGPLDSGWYTMEGAQWGFGSSPVFHDGMLIVQCDVQGQSFLAALNPDTGEEIWRTNRDEVPTWGTPTVDVRDGRAQVICNGYDHIGGYDLKTGAELWKMASRVGGDIPVPTPVVAHDLVYIMNAHGRVAPIYAISALAKGELKPKAEECEFMAWSTDRGGNYMQTPLVYGEELYACNDAGIVSCYDAPTGEEIYRERIGTGRTGFTSSGVAADGKLYFASEEGDVYVVRAGRDFEVLSENPLGEECMASPAVSEGVLYYRSRSHLTAVAEASE